MGDECHIGRKRGEVAVRGRPAALDDPDVGNGMLRGDLAQAGQHPGRNIDRNHLAR
jgi:hypothetical protein